MTSLDLAKEITVVSDMAMGSDRIWHIAYMIDVFVEEQLKGKEYNTLSRVNGHINSRMKSLLPEDME